MTVHFCFGVERTSKDNGVMAGFDSVHPTHGTLLLFIDLLTARRVPVALIFIA
jgi:hypothetical protein